MSPEADLSSNGVSPSRRLAPAPACAETVLSSRGGAGHIGPAPGPPGGASTSAGSGSRRAQAHQVARPAGAATVDPNGVFVLSRRVIARSAAVLLVLGGVLNLGAAFQPVAGDVVLLEAAIGVATAIVGLVVWGLPWERWPVRATAWLAPVAFCAVALSNAAGGKDPWSYAPFFLVVFAWIGICQPRGTSVWLLPLFVAAYVIPLYVLGQANAVALTSTIYVATAGLLIGESVAWVSARWRGTVALLQRRAAEERFRALVQHSSDLIMVVRPDGTLEYCSPAVEGMLGMSPDDLFGTELVSLVDDRDAAAVQPFLSRCMEQAGVTLSSQWRLRRRDGVVRQTETLAVNLIDQPNVGGLLLTCRDVTERRLLEERLSHEVFHDARTGLGNLALLTDRLESVLDRPEQRAGSALLFIDLDDFKAVNDRWGHRVGDQLLMIAARRLRDCVRACDTVARVGGDEFAVLLEELAGEQEAMEIAARAAATVGAPVDLDGRSVTVGASVGVVMCAGRATSGELLSRADAAMYAAKRAGKHRAVVFTGEAGEGQGPGHFTTISPCMFASRSLLPH